MNITELIKKHLNKVVKEQQESHISEDGTYMVLSNLVKIKNDIETILSFKHQTDFPKLVTGAPAWAGLAYPSVTTNVISNITSSSADSGGNVTSDGGASVTARGLVYGTSSNPTLSNSVLIIGSGLGTFSGTIPVLTAGTTYFVRAYATNSVGTGYGNQQTFTTSN
jgi:hypothetical protein